jgi:hypothetical protein
VLFGVALLALLVGLLIHRRFFHDDAYISLRYAERLLAGKGLTWNDGERIEGFSNPLWLAHIVLLGLVGVPLALAAQVLGVLYALTTVVLWCRCETSRADPAGLLVLVTVPGWALWALGGLETISACFWILLSLVLVWGMREAPPSRARALGFGFSLAAVALGRPEGIAVSLALLFAAAFGRRGRDLLLAAAPLALLYGGYQCLIVSKGVSSFESPSSTSRCRACVPAIPPMRAAFRMAGHRRHVGKGVSRACLDHRAQSTPSRPCQGRLDQFTQSSPLPGCRGGGRAG